MAVFQKLRSRLRRHPLMLPHILMMFLCISNFDILRNLKESLLVTRLGAEVIPFVKFWVVVPSALVFLLFYGFLANRLNRRQLFIVVLIPFLVWMPLFAHVIYPNLDGLALECLANSLKALLPDNLKFVSGLVLYWPLTLFFALAELWGTGVLCILFWTLLNDSYSTQSAVEAYPVITLTGNTASLFSGPLIIYCIHHFASSGDAGWQSSLTLISSIFLMFGLAMLGIHEYCCRSNKTGHISVIREPEKTTTHLPFLQSVRYLSRSPYLGCIALVMLSYCVAINMVEVAWKSQLIKLYPGESDYSLITGQLTFLMGLGCIICGLLNSKLLKRSWFSASIAVPIIMTVTAIPFFALALLNERTVSAVDLLLTGVVIGGLSNVLSKSAKYTLFDATKELAFVPLDSEQKYKGKAAIELIVSRLGKSGSAFFQQFLILVLGSLSGAIPWLAGAFILVISLWFAAVKQLNNHYLSLTLPATTLSKNSLLYDKNSISMRH